jgi:hypothetical protein
VALTEAIERLLNAGTSSNDGPAKCFVDSVLHAGSAQFCLRRRQSGLVNVDQMLSHVRSIYYRELVYPPGVPIPVEYSTSGSGHSDR